VTEKTFQSAIQYGSIALAVSAVFNVYFVMHNWEVYRDASRSELLAERMVMQEQILQGVAQDFSARANSDPNIAAIFKKAQALQMPGATANQVHP
jgi:hypothetical protein